MIVTFPIILYIKKICKSQRHHLRNLGMRDESSQYKRKRKEEKEEKKVESKVETCAFLASSAKSFLPSLTLFYR